MKTTSSDFPRDFRQFYPTVARGKGIYIWDTSGKRYIDAVGGAMVVGIGHGVSSVAQAVTAQMRKISFTHTSQFSSQPAAELARKIIAFAGAGFKGGRVYFCSGGSEAIETAVKLARVYHIENGEPSRRIIVSRAQSYHGATLGCLNLTGFLPRRRPYEVMLDQNGSFTRKIPAAYCYRCPWNLQPDTCDMPCADELETTIKQAGPENVSAFVGEPISGATLAAAVPSAGYWPRIREICDRYGVLMIADEVMTGFARTGKNFGLDHWQVRPDLVAMGKGIASGYLPLAGVLANARVCAPIARGTGRFEHGFTCHSHPVACAAGLAVLMELTSKQLARKAGTMSRHLRAGLLELKRRSSVIGDVRGLGLLLGIEFVKDVATKQPFPKEVGFASRVRDAAFKRGLIIFPGSGFLDDGTGDHIMLAPPLTLTKSQSDEILNLLEQSIEDVMKEKQ